MSDQPKGHEMYEVCMKLTREEWNALLESCRGSSMEFGLRSWFANWEAKQTPKGSIEP